MREELFTVPRPAPPLPPCTLEVAGISHCDGTYRIQRGPRYDLVVLEYVEAGRGTLEYPGGIAHPARGDVYLIHPRTWHCYYSSADSPWRKIWFNVRGPLPEALLLQYGLEKHWHIPDCPIGGLFRESLARLRADRNRAHETSSLVVHELIQAIFRVVGERGEDRASSEGRALRAYLEEQWQSSPTIEQLSAVIGRSPSQTIRIFKQDWGCTPHQFLLDRKLTLARTYLANTARSVQEIADELRFCDANYFAAFFTRKTGQSPMQFRRAQIRG